VVFYEREDVGTLLPQAIWGVGVHGTGGHGTGGVRVLRGASAAQAQASTEKEKGGYLMYELLLNWLPVVIAALAVICLLVSHEAKRSIVVIQVLLLLVVVICARALGVI